MTKNTISRFDVRLFLCRAAQKIIFLFHRDMNSKMYKIAFQNVKNPRKPVRNISSLKNIVLNDKKKNTRFYHEIMINESPCTLRGSRVRPYKHRLLRCYWIFMFCKMRNVILELVHRSLRDFRRWQLLLLCIQ